MHQLILMLHHPMRKTRMQVKTRVLGLPADRNQCIPVSHLLMGMMIQMMIHNSWLVHSLDYRASDLLLVIHHTDSQTRIPAAAVTDFLVHDKLPVVYTEPTALLLRPAGSRLQCTDFDSADDVAAVAEKRIEEEDDRRWAEVLDHKP